MIDSVFARLGILVLCTAVAFGAGWLVGYNHGHDSATARDVKVVQALTAAKVSDEATIAQLQQANAAFAASAAAEAARADKAVADTRAQQAASHKALASLQERLTEAVHANQDVERIGAERVPHGVAVVLRQ